MTQQLLAIKERPILFSGAMVRAILEGRKTQTRRVIKPRPRISSIGNFDGFTFDQDVQCWMEFYYSDGHRVKSSFRSDLKCPYGQTCDRLWCRETWRSALSETHECFAYRADMKYRCGKSVPEPDCNTAGWKPSIFMPRSVCRLVLEVTDIRVQRLKDISESDAIAEGVERDGDGWKCYGNCADHATGHDKRTSATASFMSLWDSINAEKHPWDSNPFVWIVSFRRLEEAV